MASRGYPASSSKGQVITGINEVSSKQDYFVFHSGTATSPEGQIVTNGKYKTIKYIDICTHIYYANKSKNYNVIFSGGRVLITVNIAPTLALAAARSTYCAKHILFDGKQFRTDIAHKGIARYYISIVSSSKNKIKLKD